MTQFSAGSYGEWKYDKVELQRRIDYVLENLPRVLEIAEAGSVALQGTSGVWLARDLVMAGFQVLLVRKPGEDSHGRPIEGDGRFHHNRALLLDDFVASGQTASRVYKALINHGVTLVGVLEHVGASEGPCYEERTVEYDGAPNIPIYRP